MGQSPTSLTMKLGTKETGRPTQMKMTFQTPKLKPLNFGEIKEKKSETDSKFNEIMSLSGLLNIGGQSYKSTQDDLIRKQDLGHGTCGNVVKMLHIPSRTYMAVKQMRRTGNTEENKRIIMDLEVVLKSNDCPYIVKCLGCFIRDSEVWICMELMETCLEKLIKNLKTGFPEQVLKKVVVATLNALNYLKDKHGVIHRDVKPSNILIDRDGNVKLCDFGIAGRLINSRAATRNAGCIGYMAPERIDPNLAKATYDIRADIWSFGITLVELANGKFPYKCKTEFEMMSEIMNAEPPTVEAERISDDFKKFVKRCLAKDFQQRPKYKELLKDPYVLSAKRQEKDLDAFIRSWYKVVFEETPISKRRKGGFKDGSDGSHSSFSTTLSPNPSSHSSRYESCSPFLDRLNSAPSPISRTPSTPGTPSPNRPDPLQRYSRVTPTPGSDGVHTPTYSTSSNSSVNNLTSPSPTGLSVDNNSPSPSPETSSPFQRYFYSRVFSTPEPTRKRFFDFSFIPTRNRFLNQ